MCTCASATANTAAPCASPPICFRSTSAVTACPSVPSGRMRMASNCPMRIQSLRRSTFPTKMSASLKGRYEAP